MRRSLNFTEYLRAFLCLLSVFTLGDSFHCFTNISLISNSIYTRASDSVNPLFGRTLGLCCLLQAVIRFYCAFDIYNKGLYNLTLLSLTLSCLHIISEVFIFKTAELNTPVLMNLVLTGIAVVFMFIGYRIVHEPRVITENPVKLQRQKKS